MEAAEAMQKLVGKTVAAVHAECTAVEIHFTDGDVLVLEAEGYEGTKLVGHLTYTVATDLEF